MRTLFEMRQEMLKLSELQGDPEIEHSRADEILIEAVEFFAALIDRAYPQSLWTDEVAELVESYKAVGKWYA